MNTALTPQHLVLDLLGRSVCAVQVACVIADKHGVFAWGWNHVGEGLGLHAEAHALSRANPKRLKGATVYVAAQRRKRRHPIVTAKPCEGCEQLLDAVGVHAVVYRDKDGLWVTVVAGA